MSPTGDGRTSGFRETDRWNGGVGWIAHPDETMQRASHALVNDGEVWLVDPVDCDGLDDLIAPFGDVAGVVVLLDRHTRDADALASRHDVSVHLPRTLSGVADDIHARTKTFDKTLGNTNFHAIPVVDNPIWHEVALYDADSRTLVVPEAVGTVDYFRTGSARLGVHPMLRALPPRDALSGLVIDRLLVGHGEGVSKDAEKALDAALRDARRTAPELYLKNAKKLLPV
ncbi:hypothetical protein [Halostella sp. PRR32]|uniref:hypothetical protein n=1 Tax=Halostella sp. PRR32 TaxID=3098147 RepID=UPI002B1DB904|nr:hypothetical protein [Halostella sp. PRR32]